MFIHIHLNIFYTSKEHSQIWLSICLSFRLDDSVCLFPSLSLSLSLSFSMHTHTHTHTHTYIYIYIYIYIWKKACVYVCKPFIGPQRQFKPEKNCLVTRTVKYRSLVPQFQKRGRVLDQDQRLSAFVVVSSVK